MFPQRPGAPEPHGIARARILAGSMHDVFPDDRDKRFLHRQHPQAPGQSQGKVQHA